MTLRARIVALGAGSAVAVLVLLVPAVVISAHSSARAELRSDATAVAQGVADYASSGASTLAVLAPYVDRVNSRRNRTPVTGSLADQTVLGAARTDCTATTDSRGDGGRRGGGRELSPTSAAQVAEVEGGELVRISTPATDGEITVCAFLADADVTEAVVEQTGGFGVAALAVLAAVVSVALWLARRLARDVTSAAATADRLSEGDLTARVALTGPSEVRRVGGALNRLASRIDDLLRHERETSADLSHRLRTPLMTVRLDVDALPEGPAKSELSDHLAQVERTLTAVIKAARRGSREGAVAHSPVLATVRDRWRHWAPLLEDQDRPAELDVDPAVTAGREVRCSPDDLGSALDALLENAVAHTPDGTAVDVRVLALGGGWTQVDVRDRGSGVPLHALQRGLSDRGSSGLGLDIARSCAEATGGSLVLAQDDGWSVVRLVLGPADLTPI